ncbi:MAG: UDP-N-acetylmuramate dehydrogenase [Clostridia bacterium]|nr:UDP-N-acetylmuramate dehydrogenase [Clostridia bacterium]
MINTEFIEYIKCDDTDVYENEPMNLHTSFRIGGNAECFCEVKNKNALSNVMKTCKKYNIPYFILGLGSNLLVSDNGIKGVVIKLGGDFTKITLLESDKNIVKCGAGVTLAGLCVFARNESLGGMEFAWGIPGSVGGAVYMNAGAYGGEIKDVVISSEYMDSDGNIKSFSGDELDFSYRHSAYSDSNYVITDVTFKLEPKSQAEICSRMDELMNRRKTKQPLNRPSAGSVFKRPEGYFAAALIESCGLKGFSIGDAQVSEKHSGFIINNGNATAKDVKQLIEHIKKVVKEQTGVELCCEIKYIE